MVIQDWSLIPQNEKNKDNENNWKKKEVIDYRPNLECLKFDFRWGTTMFFSSQQEQNQNFIYNFQNKFLWKKFWSQKMDFYRSSFCLFERYSDYTANIYFQFYYLMGFIGSISVLRIS